MVRKMASVQVINAVYAIEGKDRIVQYGINGWRVIDQIGKYNVGDRVVFCEIDSFIPEEHVPFMSEKKAPKEYGGVKGHVLKTIKMGGVPSQGLILCTANDEDVGYDVSDRFGIVKYDPPETGNLESKGSFPYFIPKTDQDRIQNVFGKMSALSDEVVWEVTEKMEGSSMTVYLHDGEYGVCSRNMELKDGIVNHFTEQAHKDELHTRLKLFGANIALQGELIGPNIQGNIYKLTETKFLVYDIYNIDKQKYVSVGERYAIMEQLFGDEFKNHHVPVLGMSTITGMSCEQLIAVATGESKLYNKQLREGLVFKTMDGQHSFKTISVDYLLKQK